MDEDIDTNIQNYTLAELLTILNLDMPLSRSSVIDSTNQFIIQFQKENNGEMVIFFQDIQNTLLEYIEELETSSNIVDYQPAARQTDVWLDSHKTLPQTDKTQKEKITERSNNVETYNNNHVPMSEKQLGVNNVVNIPVAQDKLNPTLTNVTTRIICLDSQYRQVTGPNDSSTDYTLDLSESLVNVLSIKPYAVQIPYSWYTVDPVSGNSCFWITLFNTSGDKQKVIAVSLEAGNYTSTTIVTNLTNSLTKAGFTFSSATPVLYDSLNGKITFYFYGGTYTEDATSSLVYTIDENTIITFFDPTNQLACSSNSCVQTNNINNTLGWNIGFRLPYENVKVNGNTGQAIINLFGPKYLIVVLDDLNQNHINNGLIGITELSKTLKLPNYYSRDLPVRCSDPKPNGSNFDANTQNLVSDVNAGVLVMDKWDVSYVSTPTVLPTAPRILTQSQIYSINEILKNNERNINYRASSPTCSDTFAIIPLGKKNMSIGDLYVEDSSTLQLNKRVYFGPVHIDRMRIKLLDDKGNVLNLNGADWCITILVEMLYQY